MFATFSRSWELVKASYGVLKSDRDLMLFPLFSLIGMIVVIAVFFVPVLASGILETAADGGELTQGQTTASIIIGFLFYFVMYTVIIFSNVALVGAAMMRLRGENPTVRDGFRIASERITAILGYAAISATIGMILNAIRGNRDNFLAQIVSGFLAMAWNVITFLVIPILVIENVGPIEAIKRSGNLLKRTWGEQLTGSFSIGMISFLVTLAVVILVGGPIMILASATNSDIVMGLGIAVIVILVAGVSLFFSTLNGIFQAALYNYATEGTAGEFFDTSLVAGAFHTK
jgi:hypothetical protein